MIRIGFGQKVGRLVLSLAIMATIGGARVVLAQAGGAVNDENVVQMEKAAKTPAEHDALAAYYKDKAAAAGQAVALHHQMVESLAGRSKEVMRRHCESLRKAAQTEQKDYEALAKAHSDMAKMAAK